MREIGVLQQEIRRLTERLSFPADAVNTVMAAFTALTVRDSDRDTLYEILSRYNAPERCDYKRMIADIQRLGEQNGVHPYTAALVLLLCLGEPLRRRYRERGLSDALFYDTLADLRYKLEECRLVHGVIGNFVAEWYDGFFDLTRFAFGRLQAELVPLGVDCVADGVTLSKDSLAINLHIPRDGTPLSHDAVRDAYRRAAAFFAPAFEGAPLVFTCRSWLLYPWNITVLSETSNLAAFYRDFTIVAEGEHDASDVWRLFDCAYNGDPDALPQDTSLRRAYAARLQRGEPVGWGHGVFVYREKPT